MRPRRLMGLCVLATAAAARGVVGAEPGPTSLGPGDLLLVTNRNVPESADLAKHYADVRHVPASQRLALDLPPGEDISPDAYDIKIAAPVRVFLQSPAGANVKCVVLFYGLPIHVSQRVTTPAEHDELAQLRKLGDAIDQRLPDLADALDAIATDMGVKTHGARGRTPPAVQQRIEFAARQIDQAQANIVDPDRRAAINTRLQGFAASAVTAAGNAMSAAGFAVTPGPPSDRPGDRLGDPQPATLNPRDVKDRATLRGLVARRAGAIQLAKLVQAQVAWISGEESDASVDSELSLVTAGDHPYYRWMPNPFNLRQSMPTLKAIMVSRIDAPTPQIARRIIDDSVAVEATGLDGKCVIDSRGIARTNEPGTYGWYDQLLRDTAVYLKAKTRLDLVADDRAQVILPGAVRGASLYCGWYSLRQYIASCGFARGAVGYHVASLEMVSLHLPGEKGWVANLLKDGVDATLGAVSEPYLSSFPRPDEFFPLLLTGRMTLAEVYWVTCPMTSWKITLIGDPLYRPFAARPQLQAADLPPYLRAELEKVTATGPSGR